MRLSTYTRIVELESGESLVMNLPRKIAGLLPREHAERLHHLADAANVDLAQYALRVGYATESTESEERTWFKGLVGSIAERRRESSVITLGLVMTNTCNLACSYCFQSDTGMRQLPQRLLSKAQVDAAFSAADKLAESGKFLAHVELFGGEPLMPSTRSSVEHAVLMAEDRKVSVRATSNGVYLDQFVDLIGPTRINDLQVSLDGSQEYHDKRRISPVAKPTFTKILDNIQLVANRGARIEVRSNIDRRNIDGVVPLLDVLEDRGLLKNPDVTFKYLNIIPDSGSNDSDADVDIFMTYSQIQNYLLANAGSHLETIRSNAAESPLAAYLAEIMGNPLIRYCGAGTSNLFFSPESKVYSCDEHVGRPEMAIANVVSDSIIPLPLWDTWSDRRIDKLRNCVDCSVALAHGGGCGAKVDPGSLATYGFCGEFPQEFDEKIRHLAKISS